MQEVYDLAIVGAGIHGSCAAYFARQAGLNVLLLEQFTLPHARGSSVGQSRITRRAYPQSYYANMMNQAYDLWESLQASFGKKLFLKTGLLYTVPSGTEAEAGLLHSFESNNYEYKRYNAAEVQEAFPQIKLGERDANRVFFWDPHAGVLLANQSLAAVQNAYIAAGGTVRDGQTVCNVEQNSTTGNVHIRTKSGNEFVAKRAILVPGAWAKRVFADIGVHVPAEPLKVFAMYWRVKESGSTSFQPPNWPAIIWETDEEDEECGQSEFYGTPELEYPGFVKMCAHFGLPIEPDERDRITAEITKGQQELVRRLSSLVSRYMPGLDGSAPSIVETCMYTETPDRDFIIDHHPQMSNVVIASCCSGHGFKMGPLIGRLLMQLATGEKPCCDLSPFRLSRFAAASASNGLTH